MSSYTLVQAQNMLAKYVAAEEEATGAQELRLGGAGLDRWWRGQTLEQLRAGRQEWAQIVRSLEASQSGAATIGGLSFSRARFNPYA
jgi:hypothetical protein